MQTQEITCTKKRKEAGRVVLPYVSVGSERKERQRKEKEIGKRRVRDLQGAWWIQNFEIDNKIICEIKS